MGAADAVKGCALCIMGLGVVGGLVTVLAFTIKALTDDWHIEQDNNCDGSHMRVYLTTLLTVGTAVGCVFNGHRSREDEESARQRTVVGLATAIAFSVWGWVEAFHNACDTVTGTVRCGREFPAQCCG